MNGNAQRDGVGEVLDVCRAYWDRNGVPAGKSAEMEAELRGHLAEALTDGKSVEDVVGRDIEGFAEEWAAPNRPARSLGEETLDVVSDAVIALAVVGGMAHLVAWSAAIPVGANDAVGALLLALLLARLFAYLRAPSDASPGSEESVLDRYPRRLHDGFMWLLVAVWAIHLLLPFRDVVLFRWPVQATLALPLLAVLIRGVRGRLARDGASSGPPLGFGGPGEQEDPAHQVANAIMDCSFHWSRMRIPEGKIDDMRRDLDEYLEQAVEDERSVRSVVGEDVQEFAEAWAEEHGAEPDPRPEPARDVVMGWVLSFSACATALATFAHLADWSLHVPVVWIVGIYLLIVAGWFGQPVADLLDRTKSWRYSSWKSMLAAALIVLVMAAVAGVMALLFMVVGPRIPFEWPWYATVVCALVACSIAAVWVRRFSREDAERERRRAARRRGSSEGV